MPEALKSDIGEEGAAAGRSAMLKAEYFICPECGAEVRVGSRGCARCASDRATKAWDKKKPPSDSASWSQDEVYDGLDIPEEDFDYDAFVEEEFGGGRRRTGWQKVWWLTAAVLLIVLATAWGMHCF